MGGASASRRNPAVLSPAPQVADIVQYIYHNMSGIAEPAAQATVKKVLHLLAQTHTDDVILTLFQLQDQSPRWAAPPAPPPGA